jgi:hypothetical protein
VGDDETELMRLNILAYIAGFVAKKISLKTSCLTCKQIIINNQNRYDKALKLFDLKQRGPLIEPSRSLIIMIAKIEEIVYNFQIQVKAQSIFNSDKLKLFVYQEILKNNDCIFTDHSEHHLVKSVTNIFLDTINRNFARVKNENKSYFLRQKLSRLLNFMGV